MAMKFYYKVAARFDPTVHRTYLCGDSVCVLGWDSYIRFSGFTHVREMVTLDGNLCGSVGERDNFAEHDFLVWEDWNPGDLYHNLPHLLRKVNGLDPATYQLLAITKEPPMPVNDISLPGFEFIGYDLMDKEGGNSALTNCGGFPDVFTPDEVNDMGILTNYQHAREIQEKLRPYYPGHPHADCWMWAIWRLTNAADALETTHSSGTQREPS